MRMVRRVDGTLVLACFALAHVVIFAGLFRGVYSMPNSGTGLYYEYAGRVLAGQVPYRDFVLEYPPLALLFFTLPRALGESFRWYYVWFQAQVVVFDLLSLAALYYAARRWSLPAVRVLGAYTVLVLAVGPINLQQYDIFPAAFTLFAVIAFAADLPVIASIWIALGVMTKVYPILLVPVFVILEWQAGRARRLWKPVVGFVATCMLLVMPWLVVAPASLRVLVDYHAGRGIHLESMYAAIAFVARSLQLGWVEVGYSYASWNITGPFVAVLLRISGIVLIATLLWSYVVIARRAARVGPASVDIRFVAHASCLVLLAAMCASKVLSPQYLVWVLPLLPLIRDTRRYAAHTLFALTGIVTYYLYPHHYEALIARSASGVIPLVVRNALVVATTIVIAQGRVEGGGEKVERSVAAG